MLRDHEPDLLQRAALGLLGADGPMLLADLVARVQAEGFDLGEDPEAVLDEALLELDELDELPDGRHVHLATVVDGAVATSWVSAEELAAGVVRLHTDLELLLVPADDEFPLAGGGTATVDLSERDIEADGMSAWILSGPAGWLDGLQPGELIACRFTGGRLHLGPAGPLGDAEAAAAALAEVFAAQSPQAARIETRHLLLAVLIDRPEVLRQPLPPLSTLLTAAGLETFGDWVGERGAPWGASNDPVGSDPHELHDLHDRHLHDPYGLDDAGREALGIALTSFELSMEQGPDELAARPDLVAGLAECLSYDRVAEAFVGELFGVGVDRQHAAAIAGWADLLRQGAPSSPGPAYLIAACMEWLGDTEQAEQHLQAALRADPEFFPALVDLAWYADDRGDAARALALLRRAGVGADDPQVEQLEPYAASGPNTAGRNEPCPCGSGRKHKVCCAPRNGYPLDTRLRWLLAKAWAFAQRPAQRDVLAAVAIARAGGNPEDQAWVEVAGSDALVADLALFEEGLLERFCDERGPLLPADELELARSWVGLRPSLYEVVRIEADEATVELRDVATGQGIRLTDPGAAADLEPTDLLFTRLLPIGDRHERGPACLRIPFTLRDRLLGLLDTDPDGLQIASWVATAEAPPQLRTFDGDPFVVCTAVLRVADPAGAAAALHELLDYEQDRWVAMAEHAQWELVLGTVTLDGDRLEVRAESEPRFEALLAEVSAAVGEAEAVCERRVPPAELVDEDDSAEPGEEDSVAPDEAAALDDFMQQAERRWIDVSVPVLGGLTPRQAAVDPTRRGDLERLLAELERHSLQGSPEVVSFDVTRLRALLGLD